MTSGIILACMYNEWAAAEVLFRAVDLEFSRREWNWQLVLVDGGSREGRPPDFLNSLSSFTSAEIVVLRRNIGRQRAIAVGLSHIFETKKSGSCGRYGCRWRGSPGGSCSPCGSAFHSFRNKDHFCRANPAIGRCAVSFSLPNLSHASLFTNRL
jgi:hypothetical protein